jgi:hypothetical protein
MEVLRIKNVVVEYDEKLSLAILTYNCKFVIHEELKKANLAFLQLIKEKNCTSCLYDISDMGLIPAESQQWSMEFFIPKLNDTTLKFMASVYSKDIFNKVSVKNMSTKITQTPYISEMFDSKAAAIRWLQQQTVSAKIAS